MTNPFDAPATEAAPATAQVAPRPTGSEDKIVVTLKGGGGYDAPWVVVHGGSPTETLSVLEDPALQQVLAKAKQLGGQFSAGQSRPPAQKTSQAPAQGGDQYQGHPIGFAQQDYTPSGSSTECPPGWTFRVGRNKAGKPYMGFFPPRGVEAQPIWIGN